MALASLEERHLVEMPWIDRFLRLRSALYDSDPNNTGQSLSANWILCLYDIV